MDKDTLLRRMASIEQRYKELEDELKRLEGEHRILRDLTDNSGQSARMRKVKKEATSAQA